MIKTASKEMGADFHELFTAMVVNRTYDYVMEKSNRDKFKSRLGDRNDTKS